MRLICPNCGAQYEVSDDVIPDVGRDVQCSNCGHTWLERPGASEAAENPDFDEQQDVQIEEGQWDEDSADPDDDDDDLTPAPQPPANRPALDASVAEILREEAEREAAARRNNTPEPMESQQDLGLTDPPAQTLEEQRNVEAARRIARLQGEAATDLPESAAVTAAAAAAASRKELLPDIEQINSTLRSSADRGENIAPSPEEIEDTKKRGFRFGFLSIIVIIGALWLLYILANPIKSAIPSLAGTVDGYVETIDNARLWLDLKVQGLTASMEDQPDSDP